MIPYIDRIVYRKDQSHDTLDNFTQTTPLGYIWLHDSVDIIVFAHTNIEGNEKSGVEWIYYKVFDTQGNTVVPGYFLMNFFALGFWEIGDTSLSNLVYDRAYRTLENYYTAQGNPYIVTNRDTLNTWTGACGNVKENCWWTKVNKEET